MSLALNEGNWWECSGDKLRAMNLRRSNFVAQGDKSDRPGGNQALQLCCCEFSSYFVELQQTDSSENNEENYYFYGVFFCFFFYYFFNFFPCKM